MSALGTGPIGSEPVAGYWQPYEGTIGPTGVTITLNALAAPLTVSVDEVIGAADAPTHQLIANTPIEAVATFTATLTEAIAALLSESFMAGDSITSTAAQTNAIAETVRISDAVSAALELLLSEGVTAGATQTDDLVVLQSLVDSMVATGTVSTQLAADNMLSAVASVMDAAHYIFQFDLADSVAASDGITPSSLVAIQLAAQSLASETNTAYLMATDSLSESATVSEALTSLLAATNTLEETVVFGFTFALGDDWYAGIATNTDGAITDYQNFPFNSFAEIDGRYFGATDTGIYELVGDDDSGTEIAAYIRTGLLDFGTSQERRLPAVYMGYRSDGTVVLKAVVTLDGTKKEYWYEMTEQTAGAFRNGRIKLGRGLKSRYWQFEIHNKDGADFAVGDIEFLPIQVMRRV